jgi:hypothetical protein
LDPEDDGSKLNFLDPEDGGKNICIRHEVNYLDPEDDGGTNNPNTKVYRPTIHIDFLRFIEKFRDNGGWWLTKSGEISRLKCLQTC